MPTKSETRHYRVAQGSLKNKLAILGVEAPGWQGAKTVVRPIWKERRGTGVHEGCGSGPDGYQRRKRAGTGSGQEETGGGLSENLHFRLSSV